MKKLDFDVFSLITPIGKPASSPEKPPSPKVRSSALMLATAIRTNRFILPQVKLVGEQMTRAPTPIRHLRFGRHEVADVDLRRAMQSLSERDQDAMRAYLWSNGQFIRDPETGKWRELDPELSDETERAFARVYRLLFKARALRPLTRAWDSGEVDHDWTAL